ncbi:MAG: hypothetical protein HY423_02945 [Candidatus Lambdaproteobacteria bacterium]|nr:hypothetical protein [Candidatus Lambdaproteobacteria bacterium]
MPQRATTLAGAYWFFMPLILVAEMMTITHSIILATLARVPNPQTALAAYNIAFSVHNIIGSPGWAMAFIALAYARDRRSSRTLLAVNAWLLIALMAGYFSVGLTPLGDWVYGTLLGGSPEVVRQARRCTVILFFIMPAVAFRSYMQALLMIHQQTLFVTMGTVARVLGALGASTVLPLWLDDGTIGAFTHLTCVNFEALVMTAAGWRFYRALPERREEPAPRYRDLWKFGWPLVVNQYAEHGVVIGISFYIGRLSQADRGQAAFGVAAGLARLLLGPVRNLTYTTQALTRGAGDRKLMLRFTWQVVAIFAGLIVLLFYTPLDRWVLHTVMGLKPEMADYVAPALLYALLMAPSWGYASTFRGLLSAAHHTGPIATASAVRIAVVLLIGLVTLLHPGMNGAVFGIVALAVAYASEGLVLGWPLLFGRLRVADAGAVPPAQPAKAETAAGPASR